MTRTLTEEGKPAGQLEGSTTVTTMMLEHRLGTTQFTLRGGTIIVSGAFIAPAGEFLRRTPVTRPILGGTGKYEGAQGVLTQSRLAGGEIRSVLKFTARGD